jgi:hypothetical protein
MVTTEDGENLKIADLYGSFDLTDKPIVTSKVPSSEI